MTGDLVMNKPEILAPAGCMEALKAAVSAGADAVYLGGASFGARAYADNFDEQTLIEAIKYCHMYGVKVYLTINTLFRDDEINQLYDYLLPYYRVGLDAVIVQDIGVMRYVHSFFPDLPIHASTQMNITTPYASSLLQDYGVTRIVPARELSNEEIRDLKNIDNPPELEVFVQGALCYCYSGQCLMSSFIGGRSGNRGRCAQPCRLPYKALDDGGNYMDTSGEFLLSPKDLCGLDNIGALIEMGVDSFKIEGRMKKPEYVAACVHAYRQVTDAWFDGYLTDDLISLCKDNMASVFNRGGFTNGYYKQHNGKNMMSMLQPGNEGVLIGKIQSFRNNQVEIKLVKDVNPGDLLVVTLSGEEIQLTCNKVGRPSSVISLNCGKIKGMKPGLLVYRVRDNQLESRLSKYITEDRKIIISGKIILKTGENAVLYVKHVIANKEYEICSFGNKVESAARQPLTKELVHEKITQLGNTRYIMEDLDIEISDDAFYSMKDLKELRRVAIHKLEEAVCNSYVRVIERTYNIEAYKDGKDLFVGDMKEMRQEEFPAIEISSCEQLAILKSYKKVKDIYIDLQYFDITTIMDIVSGDSAYNYWLVLPSVVRKDNISDILWACGDGACYFKGLVLRNIDQVAIVNSAKYEGNLVIDYSLYMMNCYSIDTVYDWIFSEKNIGNNACQRLIFTIPVELNEKEIYALLRNQQHNKNVSYQMLLYGHQQLMVSTQCILKNTSGCNNINSVTEIRDRFHKKFYAKAICKYCYHLIYNGLPTVLWDVSHDLKKEFCFNTRMHFTIETENQTKQVMEDYCDNRITKDRTKGHFSRGVE